MHSYIIRDCAYTDLEYVILLQQQWMSEDITYGYIPSDKNNLEKKLGKYFYVAEYNNEIIGYVYGTVHIAENMNIFCNGQSYIEVDDIFVLQKYRDSGLGGLLLDTLLDMAKENGIEKSLIYSSTKDIDSILNFYKKHDYKTWYIQMYK